jgi:hypothetical protein
MITFAQMLARVRRQAKDEEAAVWTDATVQACVLDALREIAQRRPESRLKKNGGMHDISPPVWPQNQDAPIPIDDWYEEALAALATSKLHLRDALDAKDESLGNYWAHRATELIGG